MDKIINNKIETNNKKQSRKNNSNQVKVVVKIIKKL